MAAQPHRERVQGESWEPARQGSALASAALAGNRIDHRRGEITRPSGQRIRAGLLENETAAVLRGDRLGAPYGCRGLRA